MGAQSGAGSRRRITSGAGQEEDQEELFLELANKVFCSDFPNPERKGCPGSQVLRQVASGKLDVDKSILVHVTKCSPCSREFSEFRSDYLARQSRARKRNIIAIAASLLLVSVLSIWFWIADSEKSTSIADGPKDGPVKTPVEGVAPLTPETSPEGTNIAQLHDIKEVDFVIPSVTRGVETGPPEIKELTLDRHRLRLRIHLPFGSEGLHEVRLHRMTDKAQIARWELNSTKEKNYVITIDYDFAEVPAGSYLLGIFPPRFKGELEAYPVKIIDVTTQAPSP